MRHAAESIDDDPQRLEEVRARRQQLRELCRKYGDTLTDVTQFHREVSARVADLEGYEERAAAIDAEREAADNAATAAADDVLAARRAAAPRLAEEVTKRLTALAMPNAWIDVQVEALDNVQFLLSANPGSPLLPLNKVASGGELARTMLALRLVMIGHEKAASGLASTLIFDEVDAGIGGTAAGAVGQALAEVAGTFQVLVVTHLAQVAAVADTQIAVTKTVVGDHTLATAELVGDEQRVAEVARMLSGDEGGAAAEHHARELLAQRQSR